MSVATGQEVTSTSRPVGGIRPLGVLSDPWWCAYYGFSSNQAMHPYPTADANGTISMTEAILFATTSAEGFMEHFMECSYKHFTLEHMWWTWVNWRDGAHRLVPGSYRCTGLRLIVRFFNRVTPDPFTPILSSVHKPMNTITPTCSSPG